MGWPASRKKLGGERSLRRVLTSTLTRPTYIKQFQSTKLVYWIASDPIEGWGSSRRAGTGPCNFQPDGGRLEDRERVDTDSENQIASAKIICVETISKEGGSPCGRPSTASRRQRHRRPSGVSGPRSRGGLSGTPISSGPRCPGRSPLGARSR